MLRYVNLSKKPGTLLRMTGLTLEQFNLLTTRLKPLWEAAERKRLSQRERKHKIGQGRRYKLESMEDKLLCLLVFYRFYLTDALLGLLFGLDASNVCRLLGKIEPLLEKAADPSLSLSLRRRIPPGARKISSWEELVQVCPDFAEIITDATEQPRQRPRKGSQRRYYSGKKKRHTLKTQITLNRAGKILLVSPIYPGSVHDYAVFNKEKTARKFPEQSAHYLDRGYDGAEKDYPEYHLILPVKRRRNHRQLRRAEKRFNKWHSGIRIIVEHVLSRLKKYQILAQVYRHKLKYYTQRFRNIAGLINFRQGLVAV